MPSVVKLGSRQAISIYNLLSGQDHLTAREIGDKLDILPNAAYRAIKQLIDLGVVRQSNSYPARYSTVPTSSALGWFLLSAQRSFKDTFATDDVLPLAKGPTMAFIKARKDLLNKTDRDVVAAKKDIEFIVSGLEVPDETVLAYRKAIAKGVRVRALLQQRSETSSEKLERWQDIGVEVRHTADLGIRLFIFDSRIVYFTSYNPRSKEQAFGVRFDYPPMAALMSNLFEENWTKHEQV